MLLSPLQTLFSCLQHWIFYIFITTLRTARKARMKTQRAYMECESCWVPNGHNEPVVLFPDLVFMFDFFFYIFLACWIYIVNKGDLWLKYADSTSACLSGHPVLSKDPVLILDTTAFDLLEEPKESVFIKNMVSVLKGLNLEKM